MSQRAVMKSVIGFGMISVPVKVYAATEDHGLKLNQAHAADGGQVKYKRVCSTCSEEVSTGDLAKIHQPSGCAPVLLTQEELDELAPEKDQAINVTQFVDLDEIGPEMWEKAYHVIPEKVGEKAYTLLRDALVSSGKVGVAKVVFRSRESLVVLRVKDDVLMMHTLHYPSEMRKPEFSFLGKQVTVSDSDREMAQAVVAGLTRPWSPDEYRDTYTDSLKALIESKAPAAVSPAGGADDLMQRLVASVAEKSGA